MRNRATPATCARKGRDSGLYPSGINSPVPRNTLRRNCRDTLVSQRLSPQRFAGASCRESRGEGTAVEAACTAAADEMSVYVIGQRLMRAGLRRGEQGEQSQHATLLSCASGAW